MKSSYYLRTVHSLKICLKTVFCIDQQKLNIQIIEIKKLNLPKGYRAFLYNLNINGQFKFVGLEILKFRCKVPLMDHHKIYGGQDYQRVPGERGGGRRGELEPEVPLVPGVVHLAPRT